MEFPRNEKETALAAMTLEEAETRLSEARTALHALMMGERVVDVWRNGSRIRYSEANRADLQAYVTELERIVAELTRVEAGSPRRRPIALAYRN